MRTLFLTLALLLLVGTKPTSAAQEGTLEDAMDQLSKSIAQYLVSHSPGVVAVESFRAPPRMGNHMQVGRRLREKLEAHDQIKVVDADDFNSKPWSIRGDVAVRTINGKTLAQITARIIDDSGLEQHTLIPPQSSVPTTPPAVAGQPKANAIKQPTTEVYPAQVKDITDVTKLAGTTYDASSQSSSKGLQQTLASAISQPSISVVNGRISPTKQSPFAIELLFSDNIRPDGRPPSRSDFAADPSRIPVVQNQSFAQAIMKAGELFAIRIHNNADHDVAVQLFIDGLSSFEFSSVEAYRKADHWVVPRKSQGQIYGWHRTNDRSDAFEVAHLPDTAVKQLGRPTDKIGTIQAIFFPAWKANESPPLGFRARGGAASDALGVKRGEEVSVQHAEARRFTASQPVASITIHTKPLDDLPPGIGG